MTNPNVPDDFAALIGIDWAGGRNPIGLKAYGSNKLEYSAIKQKPEALQEWIAQLQARFAGGKIAVALEQYRGALSYALMNYEFLILYPVNPKSLCRYREAFRTSGAK